jgi:hypothetical protein
VNAVITLEKQQNQIYPGKSLKNPWNIKTSPEIENSSSKNIKTPGNGVITRDKKMTKAKIRKDVRDFPIIIG